MGRLHELFPQFTVHILRILQYFMLLLRQRIVYIYNIHIIYVNILYLLYYIYILYLHILYVNNTLPLAHEISRHFWAAYGCIDNKG